MRTGDSGQYFGTGRAESVAVDAVGAVGDYVDEEQEAL
jgi:hypothetical protein